MSTYSFENIKRNNNLFRLLKHPQNSNEPHSHNFLELAYLTDGTCTHILNGKSTTLIPGDYVIIDYNSVHCYNCGDSKPFTLIDCIFKPEFIDRSLKDCNSFKNLVSSYQIGIDYSSLSFNPTDYTFHDNNGFIKQLLMLCFMNTITKRAAILTLQDTAFRKSLL